MKKSSPTIFPLAPAHLVGLGAFQTSFLLLFLKPEFSPVPLGVFVLLCLMAPFFSRFSFFLPIISKGKGEGKNVSLTFDDGPDPDITPGVLGLLKKYGVRATFFVTGKKAESNPQLIKQIISAGHEIGNHSYSHDLLVMLKSARTLKREINKTNDVLNKFGIRPIVFRPPVGITNPKLWSLLLHSGMICVNFSCRPYDMGNRFIARLSQRVLEKVKVNDIVLLHDIKPTDEGKTKLLFDEIEKIITGITNKGLNIVPLSKLIKRPVMTSVNKDLGPVETFYNALAVDYDKEQKSSKVLPARKKEIELFNSNFLSIVKDSYDVLELGAGTGRFTIPISNKCEEIYALDISKSMIDVLENKLTNTNINNIRTIVGDIISMDENKKFDMFCSFSSLEYIPDISMIFKKVYELLKPGGEIYFITANRSIPRLFVQIGNALRQGIWLHSRGKREIVNKLKKSGFSQVRVSTHGLKFLFFGGLLMEVSARKNDKC